jgi:hypothetical protein
MCVRFPRAHTPISDSGKDIVGALLYAERMPERFFPGSFDYVGASHQSTRSGRTRPTELS